MPDTAAATQITARHAVFGFNGETSLALHLGPIGRSGDVESRIVCLENEVRLNASTDHFDRGGGRIHQRGPGS